MDFLFDTMLCRELEIEAKSKLSNVLAVMQTRKSADCFWIFTSIFDNHLKNEMENEVIEV